MADFIMYIMGVVNMWGYIGVFAATALEYACFPVSSEILLPFIGCCVYNGGKSLVGAVLVSTAGAAAGCTVCFYIGRMGKNFIIDKLGRFKAVREGIENACEKFDRYGTFSVFILRMLPFARTYISFPAGMSNMTYTEFILYTVAGSFVWNSALISAGYLLGEYWEKVSDFMYANKAAFNVVFFVFILIVVLNFVLGRVKKRN